MQFLYDKRAGENGIEIKDDSYRYLFRVKRYKKGEKIALRNLEDEYIYFYKIEDVNKKSAYILLLEKERKIIKPKKEFHLVWCVVDPKVVEKTIPFLNEIGVKKITFVYCDRSQKSFKLKYDKLRKIAINSSQQCGRSTIVQMEFIDTLSELFEKYSDIVIVDFGGKKKTDFSDLKRVMVGCEGGFSENEREFFKDKDIIGFDSDMILKSETAAIGISAKVLL